MADFGAPVAAGIQPSNGIQTISSLLGLKQQQLALSQQQLDIQQRQQTLSSLTSQASQAAIHTQNLQNLQSVNWNQFSTSDGYDIQAAEQKALQVGGADGPPFVERLATMSQQGTAAKKAFFDLNQEYQAPIRAALGTWGADPNATVADLATRFDQIEGTVPKENQGAIRTIANNTLSLLTGPETLSGAPRSPQQQHAMAVAFSRAGLTESEVGGPGGLATPVPGAVASGAYNIPTATNRMTGARTSQGGAIAEVLPPTVVSPHPGAGPPTVIGGAGGTPNAPTSPAKGGGQMPNWWTAAANNAQLNQVNVAALGSRIAAGNQAANAAPTAIDALERSRAILDQSGVSTGTLFPGIKDMRNALASMGVDTSGAQNMSELAKNLARYEASRAGSVGDTDAARSLYEAGAPNTKMDKAAVNAVILQSLGIERMIQGYAKAVGGAPSAQEAMAAEQKFRSIPHLVQAYELGFMRNKAEADEFFGRYGVSGRDLAKSAAELRAMGAL